VDEEDNPGRFTLPKPPYEQEEEEEDEEEEEYNGSRKEENGGHKGETEKAEKQTEDKSLEMPPKEKKEPEKGGANGWSQSTGEPKEEKKSDSSFLLPNSLPGDNKTSLFGFTQQPSPPTSFTAFEAFNFTKTTADSPKSNPLQSDEKKEDKKQAPASPQDKSKDIEAPTFATKPTEAPTFATKPTEAPTFATKPTEAPTFATKSTSEPKDDAGKPSLFSSLNSSPFALGTSSSASFNVDTTPSSATSFSFLGAKNEDKNEDKNENKQKEKEASSSSAKTEVAKTSSSPAETKAPSTSFFVPKNDTFTGFSVPKTTAATLFGFTPSLTQKQEGWKCACCTTENPETSPTCTVCLVPRPPPKPATTPAASTADTEKDGKSNTPLFGLGETSKPDSNPPLKEETKEKLTLGFVFSAKPTQEEKPWAVERKQEQPAKNPEDSKQDSKPAFGAFGSLLGSNPAGPLSLSSFSSSSTSTPSSALASSQALFGAPSTASTVQMFSTSTPVFSFGTTGQDTKNDTKGPATAAASIFSFGGPSVTQPSAKEDDDTMTDSSDSMASGGNQAFTFYAPGTTPSLPALPSTGSMYVFGGSAPPATNSSLALPSSSSNIAFGRSFSNTTASPFSTPSGGTTVSSPFSFGSNLGSVPTSTPTFGGSAVEAAGQGFSHGTYTSNHRPGHQKVTHRRSGRQT